MKPDLSSISHQAISEVMKHPVVLPALYHEAFNKIAQELGIDITEESMEALLSDDLDKYYKVMESTHDNLEKLETFTESAQVAIVNKDDKNLGLITADIKILQQELKSLKKELHTDGLTKSNNRRWISDTLLKDNKFMNDGLLVFIDLNDFKKINDTYGHNLGDKVLLFYAEFMRKNINPEKDAFVRYAGDEFLIIHNDRQDILKLKTFLTAVREKLSSTKLKAKGSIIHIKFSFGIAPFSKDDDFLDILEAADDDMYQDKQSSKI